MKMNQNAALLADMRDRTKTFVETLAGCEVESGDALISSRLLESLAAVQLIDFVEAEFDMTVDDDDIVLANFDSVDAIVALVHSRTAPV
jgi:acyl carrier protein